MTPRRWRVGVHLGLSRASDVTRVCQYKGDSKSEQMAFIVDHSPCRDAVRPYTIVPYGISRKTRRRYRLPTTPSNKPPEGEREREREGEREKLRTESESQGQISGQLCASRRAYIIYHGLRSADGLAALARLIIATIALSAIPSGSIGRIALVRLRGPASCIIRERNPGKERDGTARNSNGVKREKKRTRCTGDHRSATKGTAFIYRA